MLCLVTQSHCNPPGSSVHGDSPGKNTRVGCHALPQRVFPTQGPNPCLLRCRQILYLLTHQGSPRILEWVAFPFSRGSSLPRNPSRVGLQADSLPAELPGKPVKPSKSFQMIKYFKSSMLVQSQGLLSFYLKVSFHSFAKVFLCPLGGHFVLACLSCHNKIP